ncbi:MAG: oxidoreductase [Alphaproteobacteria bacterium]|nr:oxidoreductase [Alphaproteobacteria bacterium]
MSDKFRALLIEKTGDTQSVAERQLSRSELMDGDVTILVSHSTVNYKDGLALTGRSPVVRRFPMIPGIDLAGTVESSSHPGFQPGDRVLVNGFGLGETHYGGYSEVARVKGDWLVRLPDAFTPAQAMAIGTAGYTAMLALLALEDAGIRPQMGPVLVTGATGGVGSVAVSLLAGRGFEVHAVTGKSQEAAYLEALGARVILPRAELSGAPRPLAKERWAAAIDSVGSSTLANVLASIRYGGAVAACGLAQGMDLPTSVAPFILRGISLHGIESVHMAMERRQLAWNRLAQDLDRAKLDAMTRSIGLSEVVAAGNEILAGQVRGRIVVQLAA